MPIRIAALVSALLAFSAFAGEELIFDFESPKQAFESADKLQYVPEHATQGKLAGKVTLDKAVALNIFFFGGSNQCGKWGDYDQFVYDVFVEGGPAKVYGFVRDKQGMDWWKRHNFELKLQPGKRRLAFSLGAFTRQNGNGSLDLKSIDFFAISFDSEDPKNPATLYLDNARLVKGTGNYEVKVLYSFEGADAGKFELEDWPEEFKGKSAMTPVEEHATAGKKALKLESRAPAGNVQFSGFDGNWNAYDTLALDIFNAADKTAQISGWIRAGDVNAGWWDRHNWERMLKPGFNTVRMSVGGITSPKGNKPIDTANVVKFNLAVDRTTLFIDNVRLIKGVEEIPVAGLKKFDFGPENSAVMPGFAKITKASGYDPAKGCGWLPGGQFGRDFDIMEMLGRHRPPDDLTRDFCMPTQATFAVDVPDGSYGVWLMLGPPGNGWGQTFQHRSVTANGKVVVDETFDINSFKKHEFRFEDEEDLPGDDLWEKYIDKLFRPARFDVEVAGGQLKLDFNSYGSWWCAMVDGLVLWPKASANDAERWLANFDALRKEQFQAMHVEKTPEAKTYAATEDDKKRGYVLFVHSADRAVEVNSVPAPEEIQTTALTLAGAPGEYVTGCVGLYPLKDCGQIARAECSVPCAVSAGNARAENTIQGAVRVQRYKALNKTAVYDIVPKYLDDVAVKPVSLKAGVTRSFWATLQIPANAEGGEYSGSLKLTGAQGGEITVPVKLTVWPIKLVEPKFPMGMFMMGPMHAYLAFDPKGEEYWQTWKQILEDARAHGLTSVDPAISIPLQRIVNGKAEVDFSAGDRFMELAKAAGFSQELNGYNVGSGINLRVQANYDAEAKRFGVASYAEAVKAYFDAVREHAKEKGWLPICFCTDDEYIVHPGGDAARLASHHKLLQDNAPGFRFVAFDSAYLEEQPQNRAAREQMLADIDTWGAGVHGPREVEVVKAAKRRLWLYNTGMNRFTFGTYMFFARQKYNVEGFFQWVYTGGGTYSNFYLASHVEAHYGVVYPSSRGLRTTPTWERIRTGCSDHRYLETAWQLIAQAKAQNKGAAAAKALEDAIETVMKKLKFGKPHADAISGEGKADNPLDCSGMESFRKSVAEGILKLQDALK
jgi:hypothetical protein